jgi:hypothetical protein
MKRERRIRLTYANVVASLALFAALGGSSYAAISITGKQVSDGSLSGRDVHNGSLTGTGHARPVATGSRLQGGAVAGRPSGTDG